MPKDKKMRPKASSPQKHSEKKSTLDMLQRGCDALQKSKQNTTIQQRGTESEPVVINTVQDIESFAIYHMTQGSKGPAYLLINGAVRKIQLDQLDIMSLIELM